MTGSVELANGVRVVLQHRPDMVGVALVVHVGVGYDDDPIGVPGAAHLFEHLMTQDARPPVTASSLALVQSAGGRAGATTHAGHTEFWYHLPAPLLPSVLQQQAARLARPRFTADHLAAQLDGITAEIDERTRTGWGRLPWPALPPLMYDDWPHGHDGLGDPEALRDLTHADCVRFHAETYLRAPLVVSIAADLGPARRSATAVLDLVRDAFGTLPRRVASRSAHRGSLRPPDSAGVGVPDGAVGVSATALVVPTRDRLTGALAAAVIARALVRNDDGPLAATVGWHGLLDTAGDEVLVVVDRPDEGGATRTAARLEALARPGATGLATAADLVRRQLSALLDDGVAAARWAGRGEVLWRRAGLLPDAIRAIDRIDPGELRATAARLGGEPAHVVHGVPAAVPRPPVGSRSPAATAALAPPRGSAPLELPALPVVPDRVEQTDGGLVVVRVPRGTGVVEARLVVALPGLSARRREQLALVARTLCPQAADIDSPGVRWMGDLLVVAARHVAGREPEREIVAGWTRLAGALRAAAMAPGPGSVAASVRPDWAAQDLACPAPEGPGGPSHLVLVGPVTGTGTDPWPAPATGTPPWPGAGVATGQLAGSPAGAAVLLGPAGDIASAPAHLAVAVLAGAGRRHLGAGAPRTRAAAGLLAAGREPSAQGPARPFVRASSAPGRLARLLEELDELLRRAVAVPDDEVAAATTFCRGQWALAHDDPASHADQLAQHLSFGGEPGTHHLFAEALRTTPADDVRRALAVLFDPAALRGAAVDAGPVALPAGWTAAAIRSSPRSTPGWQPRDASAR